MKDWAYVVVAIKLKWLHQKLGAYHAAGKEKRCVVLLQVKLIFSRIICSCFCTGYMKFTNLGSFSYAFAPLSISSPLWNLSS